MHSQMVQLLIIQALFFLNETPKKQNDFVAKTQTEILPYVCFLRINAGKFISTDIELTIKGTVQFRPYFNIMFFSF